MRATTSLLVTSLLLSLLAFDHQVLASHQSSAPTSNTQYTLSAKVKKTKRQPTTYRGSGRRGEDGMI